MKKIPVIAYFFVAFMLIVGVLVFLIEQQKENPLGSQKKVLQVLSYSAFMSEWGAGPLLAKEFEEETHIKIQWIDAGNAGQIVESLKKSSRPIDSVVGIDLISVLEAQKNFQWKKLNRYNTYFSRDLPSTIIFDYFLPIDWSPMTFIFKKKGLPPQRLDDLLKPEFANSLGLQDPNLSSTGFYFLTWILAVRGYEDGFNFIKNLKSSIRVVSPSWSASYGLFQNDLTPMVFSFFTSPLYHHLNEKDFRYQPIYFDEPLIYSVEYMAIPSTCQNCEEAQLWVEFLLRMSSQRIIMEKNFMLPAVEGIRRGTAFDFSKSIQLIKPNDYLKIIQDKAKILEQWNQLGM
ncbi:thiamine ABC transporter substrate-binding protein [bacterium]|nr:thiamine ABC transporter substrate-binding protein [bacterium]